ncbi:MAG: TonB-dependent receptor [Bradyrhizobiaceae bacterium]|nr:TonB-dependent receptor [Bradyrhizobiaceae bacterium]
MPVAFSQEAKLPAAPVIYDPLGGPDLRNPHRTDLAQCSLWYGGPAGTLVPAGVTPPPVPPDGLHGMLAAGYAGACGRAESLATVSAAANGAFIRATGYMEKAGDYKDGSGNTVRYGYDRALYGGGFGFSKPDGSYLSFDAMRAEKNDVLYATAPLDSRFFNATNFSTRGQAVLEGGPVRALRGNLAYVDYDRENDNFSYRALVGQPTLAQFDRRTLKGAVEADIAGGPLFWTVGVDLDHDWRDATRYQRPTLAAQSRVVPDAHVTQVGVRADAKWRPTVDSRLIAGARLDFVDAGLDAIDAAGLVTPGFGATPTPRALYAQYYGYAGDGSARETNVSAQLRFEKDFDAGAGQWFAAIRRHVRTADVRERYFASFTPPSGDLLEPGPVHRTWIGNPLLKPEQHHLAEIGSGWSRGGWQAATRLYADRVTDFILHDRARGQSGILVANNANIFRNVDAFIAGFDAMLGYRFGNGVYINGTLNATYGQNLTDDLPIAQIPPLEGSIRLGWSNAQWGAEARVRMVATQTRTDSYFRTGSGDDGNGLVVVPGGFTTVDVALRWEPRPNVTFVAGVENVFDTLYTEYIDRNDIDDPFVANPPAAGRSFFVRGNLRF